MAKLPSVQAKIHHTVRHGAPKGKMLQTTKAGQAPHMSRHQMPVRRVPHEAQKRSVSQNVSYQSRASSSHRSGWWVGVLGGGGGERNFRITGDGWAPRTVHVQTKICRRRDGRASKSEKKKTKTRFYKSIPTFDSRMFFQGGETTDKPDLFHVQECLCKAETRPGF